MLNEKGMLKGIFFQKDYGSIEGTELEPDLKSVVEDFINKANELPKDFYLTLHQKPEDGRSLFLKDPRLIFLLTIVLLSLGGEPQITNTAFHELARNRHFEELLIIMGTQMANFAPGILRFLRKR